MTRREIDELTERAKRFGGKGLAHLALEPGGEVKGPIAKFLSDETQRALIERTGAAEGDLILIVADAAGRDGRRPGPPSRGAGRTPRPGRPERPRLRLGPPLPDVPVGRRGRTLGRDPQPVLGRRARRRAAAGHRPRAIRAGRRPTIRPAGPGRSSTTWRSTAGSWAAGRCGSIGATCSSGASSSRATRSRACARSSGPSSRPSSTALRRTAASPSASTAGRPCSRTSRRSARSWPSRRPSPATTRCSRPRRRPSRASSRSSGCASSACRGETTARPTDG